MSRLRQSDGLITIDFDMATHLSPVLTRSYPVMTMDVRMSKPQMRAAVEQFLGHITEAEWAEWVQELSPSLIADAVREATLPPIAEELWAELSGPKEAP